MARSGDNEHCATYLASEYQNGRFQKGPIFFTIQMATRAVCDIEQGLLHQSTANILVAPPASERRNADTKECRCLFFSDISVANLLLSCWQRPKSSDHPASRLLDGFLFLQSDESRDPTNNRGSAN